MIRTMKNRKTCENINILCSLHIGFFLDRKSEIRKNLILSAETTGIMYVHNSHKYIYTFESSQKDSMIFMIFTPLYLTLGNHDAFS